MASERFVRALDGEREVDLTVTGRSSGKRISHPVWFIQGSDTIYMLPVGGSGSNWYKNVVKTPTIRLAAHGVARETKASVITKDADVKDVLTKFRAKYGARSVTDSYPKQDVAVVARID